MDNKMIFINDSISRHTGKMEGVRSISTSALANPSCIARREDKNAICANCYACKYLKLRKTLREKCARNSIFYTTEHLQKEDIPRLNDKIFRFEAFGELENVTQLANYNNIAWYNPDTIFTLWSKRPDIIERFYTSEVRAYNFNIILSSRFINQSDYKYYLDNYGRGFFDGVFTVYTKEHAEAHNIPINGRSGRGACNNCRLCYMERDHDREPFEINELIK